MSAILPLLSAPESLTPFISAFHMGLDQAFFFYASNPRTAVTLVLLFLYAIYYLREVVKVIRLLLMLPLLLPFFSIFLRLTRTPCVCFCVLHARCSTVADCH